MAKYNYKKYSVNTSSYYTMNGTYQGISENSSVSGYSDYDFDSSNGTFNHSGSSVTVTKTNCQSCYSCSGGTSMAGFSSDGTNIYVTTYTSSKNTSYSKGSYIETVVAESGTYPSNGQSGGYWYEKTTLAETATITAPNGGETVDKTYNIAFTPSNSALSTEISLSQDNGQTWKVLGTAAAGAVSFSYDFTNETESAQCLIRARTVDGSNYGAYDQSDGVFTICHNVAPTAPTNLSPSSVAIDRTKVQRLSWKHNDTDAQSKFDLQYSVDGTNWTTVTQTSTDEFWDASANLFAAGTIYWKVRTYDSQGLVSPYSTQAAFTAANPSNNPVITSPTNSIPVARPQIQWTQPDQADYQINILDNLSNIVWDSGDTVSTNRQAVCGADLLNGGTYTIKVKTKSAAGLWTDWASTTLAVSYTPPAIPTIETMIDNDRCSIELDITHPTPTGTQPEVSYSDIFRSKANENNFIRIATNIANTFIDYTAQPEQIYEYRVKEIGSNGTSSLSDIVQASANMEDAQLALTSDYTQYIDLVVEPQRQEKYGKQGIQVQFAGRELPVTYWQEGKTRELPISYRIDNLDMLYALDDTGETLLYRDNRGRKIFCTIPSQISTTDISKTSIYKYTVSFTLEAVDYDEEV